MVNRISAMESCRNAFEFRIIRRAVRGNVPHCNMIVLNVRFVTSSRAIAN